MTCALLLRVQVVLAVGKARSVCVSPKSLLCITLVLGTCFGPNCSDTNSSNRVPLPHLALLCTGR
jgi:hypothetical protein